MLSAETKISSIIIDGYNLIGIYHRDLESQRERLINRIIDYNKNRGHSIVVVFDGWKSGRGAESSSMRSGVRIIYSGLGEKADLVIKRIISTERREWIVVTSDREIADHAWSQNCIPVPSDTFLSRIEVPGSGPYRPDLSDEEKDEDDTAGHERRKGNPLKLSRKEKAMRRALLRL